MTPEATPQVINLLKSIDSSLDYLVFVVTVFAIGGVVEWVKRG